MGRRIPTTQKALHQIHHLYISRISQNDLGFYSFDGTAQGAGRRETSRIETCFAFDFLLPILQDDTEYKSVVCVIDVVKIAEISRF